MAVNIGFTMENTTMTARGHNTAKRTVFRNLMNVIRYVFWPRHFTNRSETQPGGAYGYEKRSKGYQLFKARTKGHQKPLVLSGKMKAHIIANARVTATSNRGRITARNYFPMTVERRQEVEAISAAERKDLVDRAAKIYTRMANSTQYQRRRRRST